MEIDFDSLKKTLLSPGRSVWFSLSAGGLANYQPYRQGQPNGRGSRIGEAAQQPFHSLPADFRQGRLTGRQRRTRGLRTALIVGADDGQIFRHPPAGR
jgi:hypothetical protein